MQWLWTQDCWQEATKSRGGGDNTDGDVNTSKGSAFEADDDVASPSKNCWD